MEFSGRLTRNPAPKPARWGARVAAVPHARAIEFQAVTRGWDTAEAPPPNSIHSEAPVIARVTVRGVKTDLQRWRISVTAQPRRYGAGYQPAASGVVWLLSCMFIPQWSHYCRCSRSRASRAPILCAQSAPPAANQEVKSSPPWLVPRVSLVSVCSPIHRPDGREVVALVRQVGGKPGRQLNVNWSPTPTRLKSVSDQIDLTIPPPKGRSPPVRVDQDGVGFGRGPRADSRV